MKKIICSLFIICLILAACGGSDNDKIYHVAYTVDGSCLGYSIYYQNQYGKLFETVENSTWSYTFNAQKGDYLFLRVDGLNYAQDPHTFSARILINNEIIAIGYCLDPNCKGIELDLAV